MKKAGFLLGLFFALQLIITFNYNPFIVSGRSDFGAGKPTSSVSKPICGQLFFR